jgi:hypothetical protein
MPRMNYNQAKRQKELARKARQQEKQQRREAKSAPHEQSATDSPDPLAGARPPAPDSAP